MHRVGACQNCGDCCILWTGTRYVRCAFYTLDAAQHCTIYPARPPTCRDYPREPIDVAYKPRCGYRFVDDAGHTVDGYMDRRTQRRLQRVYSHTKMTTRKQEV